MDVSNNANTWLNQFKVEVTSNASRVFGNGRQQLEATVSVSARSNHTISREQLDSITLVTLDDDGVYRELQGKLQVAASKNPLFDYYGATGSSPANIELGGSGVRRKRLYVSSTRVGGSLDRIYARISKDAATHYVTDGGPFNSLITVETLAPLRHVDSDLSMSAENVFKSDDLEVDRFSLRFKSSKLRIVAATRYDGFPDGGYHYRSVYDSRWDPFSENTFHFYNTHYAFNVGPKLEIDIEGQTVEINHRPGEMNFVRTSTVVWSDRPPVDDWETSSWGLLDQYGNEHKIELTDEDNGRRIGFKNLT